ncbi:HTH-type transcriptional regulator ArgP [Methylibium petroleiphilum]|uniref:HTH-type transcriptional regulator ArgP n=1 Tax=Methylibium petroleiphilum TaxID=105560 RepID=UPI001AC28C18|nr:HTH-type transcriptional regulator ArgP [Methylibium petroleiphilum]MBN9206135.1 HTH-type transcriptional regulator ArgP [Methylibium petroleiphilum]
MLDRDQLETFATVAEVQSFERAAALLNITRGAVSQRIKALEESLTTVLLMREKPITPTAAGEVLLRHVKALRLLEGATLGELKPQPGPRVPVPLAIAVNADSLATWFPRALWELLLRRQVALEIVTDDQDHTSGRLARGEVIGCIATDAKPATGFSAECLGAMEYRCYATPDFAAEYFPNGLNVQAVLTAPAILFNRKDSLHDDFLKRQFGFAVDRYPRHYLPSPMALLEGVAVGVGYGLVPSLQAAAAAERGELVDLASDAPVLVDLYWHHWELEPPLSREITDLVVNHAKTQLLAREAPQAAEAKASTLKAADVD